MAPVRRPARALVQPALIGCLTDLVREQIVDHAATLLGRLAVDLRLRGQGMGEHLLMDAMCRALEASGEVASVAVVVDAKDENAVAFYRRYEFIPFADAANRLFFPMRTIAQLFCPGGYSETVNVDIIPECRCSAMWQWSIHFPGFDMSTRMSIVEPTGTIAVSFQTRFSFGTPSSDRTR